MGMIDISNLIKAAYVKAAHGVRGAVKVKVLLEDFDLFQQQHYFLDDLGAKYEVEEISGTIDGAIVYLTMIGDRDIALGLKGKVLYMPHENLPEIHDEYYLHEIEGMQVYLDDKYVGDVIKLLDHGAGSMIEVTTIEDYIPFDDDHILTVDNESKKLLLKQLPVYI